MRKLAKAFVVVSAFAMGGCAFDVVHVSQQPVAFTPSHDANASFRLLNNVEAKLGTGFPTYLHGGTNWTKAGDIPQGGVFKTADQIVKVEASNIQEAWAVVAHDSLVGFYTPVEHTYVPLNQPVPLLLEH